MRPDVAFATSRRSKRYVVTQQKIRRDVISEASWLPSGNFFVGNENGETLCHTLYLTIHLFQTFSPNKSSNPTSL